MFKPKYLKRFGSYCAGMISIVKLAKKNNSVKMKVELWLLFSARPLIMLNICTKFRENISKISELLSGHDFHSEIF